MDVKGTSRWPVLRHLDQPSRKQAAMLIHKEFVARTYSHHMYALTALVKNLVKKTRTNGFESVFCNKCCARNYYGSGSWDKCSLLGKFWASHIVKARGSGNFRENGCKRVFCKKKIIIALSLF